MLQSLAVEATGTNLAVGLNTDDLIKLFGAVGPDGRARGININSMTIYLASFGSATDIIFFADSPEELDEAAGDATTLTHAIVANSITANLQGSSGALLAVPRPAVKTFFRFTTADVAPQFKPFSLFPIFNNLQIGWTADVDFTIEFDFTILDEFMDFRAEIMDLLDNKTQVEDPNISNIDGKRALVRAPLQIVAD